MGKLPAFPLYASDFYMDTATWENDELGAYLRLLLYEWINGGLPDDTYKLAKIAKESQRKFVDKWKNLSHKFTLNGNGLLINQKMESVRQEKLYYIESQREKGIKSAKKRWEGHITRVTTTVKKRLQPEDNPSSSSSISSSKEKKIIKEKNVFGEFQNVKLTEDEYIKLVKLYGESGTNSRIENLSSYVASKGKKYSSHYATILSWERKHEVQNSKSW